MSSIGCVAKLFGLCRVFMVTTIDRQAVPTAFVGEIIDVAKEHAGAIRKPVGLIVLDHARMMADTLFATRG